ncbi:regulatory protein, luxR family [Rubritalea squalenifaciens DSM 18772]|uniref:Regulatory protein, luxR family n=1 Tax=Rubritalea squalenifaciens DSM 18772 TaxID=1123071 RepID=A0A1M6HZ00_9BACT|nr:helix-turn-helix transcriptional regulator [Rubritalea squalenifaciens]SHJ27377.1 regulatory protein, luxR family [Rubritalea squalenifaciens DSM 18772]
MLRHSTLQHFNEAVAKLYQADLNIRNYERKCYEFLNSIIPSEFIVFGSLNLKNEQLSLEISESVSDFPEAMEAFGQLMGQYPLFRWDPQVNSGKPFYREDFYSRREFRELDIFSEVYTKIGVDSHCAIHVPSNQQEIAFFGIERMGSQDFTVEERALLDLCQTHLSNARSLVFSLADQQDKQVSPDALYASGLTPREADVLTWLSEGKSNDEIAILLQIGLHTVKGHLKSIFQKIGAHNRLEAALWAIRMSNRGNLDRDPIKHVDVRINTHAYPSIEG